MADYPASIPDLTTGVPSDGDAASTPLGDDDYPHDDHHRDLGQEVEAIATELGTSPSGASVDVAARFAVVEAVADAAQTAGEVAAAVAAHEADTSVHGIADTTVLATDAEVVAAVAAEAALARNADNLTSGTVADARIASTIARDSEVTALIVAAIDDLLDGAPGALDTLNELAAAINDDASFAATVTTALAGKQPLDADLTALAALTAPATQITDATAHINDPTAAHPASAISVSGGTDVQAGLEAIGAGISGLASSVSGLQTSVSGLVIVDGDLADAIAAEAAARDDADDAILALPQFDGTFDSVDRIQFYKSYTDAVHQQWQIASIQENLATSASPVPTAIQSLVSHVTYGSASVDARGVVHNIHNELIVLGAANPATELASNFAYIRCGTAAKPTQFRAWMTDWGIHGPIAAQPPILNGVTMYMGNYYNGSPSANPSSAFNAHTRYGQGPGAPTGSDHKTAATYPVDVGFAVTGTSGSSHNVRGWHKAFEFGGSASPWLGNTPSSIIGIGLHGQQWEDHGILILEPLENDGVHVELRVGDSQTGDAIRVTTDDGVTAKFRVLSDGRAKVAAATEAGDALNTTAADALYRRDDTAIPAADVDFGGGLDLVEAFTALSAIAQADSFRILAPVDIPAAATNFSTNTQSNSRHLAGYQLSSGAQNAEVVYRVPQSLAAGTWSLRLVHSTNTSNGIYTIATSPDGSTFTDLTTIDGYAGSAVAAVITDATGLTVPAGTTYLRLKMATKNGSSSNYFGAFSALTGVRTA